MPRRVKSKSAANNKISNTVKLLRQLKRPAIYVPALIVLGIIVYFGLQQYRSAREREAFQKLEQATTLAVGAITQSLGTPLFSDKANTCSMEAPQEFSGKELFCNATTILYYRTTSDDVGQFTIKAKDALEKNFGVTLQDEASPQKPKSVIYNFGAHTLKDFGNISCAMSIQYPTIVRGGVDTPSRHFIDDNITSIGISCDKQVAKAIYPMVNR